MTKRMLIDSTHAEETRVVVLDGNRLDEFDLETSTKHQLKGNIYLAKVVRVEPSLQAAFVEYGGNRHGFLAFGEIHPDYYQIPVADRKRLIEAQEQEAREDEEAEEREAAAEDGRSRPRRRERSGGDDDAGGAVKAALTDEGPEDGFGAGETAGEDGAPLTVDPLSTEIAAAVDAAVADAVLEGEAEPTLEGAVPPLERVQTAQPAAIAADMIVAPDEAAAMFPDAAEPIPAPMDAADTGESVAVADGAEASSDGTEGIELAGAEHGAGTDDETGPAPEQIGGEHDTEDQPARRATPRFLRNYKIQEVIRRRQVLLIQVVKEERGSKGAALTTYISLAGRFSVLMPNSPRGGGISRKITSASDRRRLKEVTAELDLPRGMGLIVRTAGANRPKPEILRDCEYLLNQWDQIREMTMKSMAPALIYEEASLIKRAIRDVYSRDVDDILVDGEQGWRAARDFMRMLMPTHARKVQLWKEPQPLFAKAQVEQQLEAMLAPTVQLRSGGYLVINQTEALVAIDVNSGRSTRERGIEETALRTNLEAAEEAARQLRLRDLAGLIVIDFIDMESRRNVASVERRLKEALKHDRARIQVGPISHFGLLEMSRQRLRPSLTETNFVLCAHCGGTGHVRSTESAALHVLRAIEEEGGKRRAAEVVVHCAASIALYVLNYKRQRLSEIEARHAMLVTFAADDHLLPPNCRIEKVRAQAATDAPLPVQQLAPPEPFEDPDELEAEVEEADDDVSTGSATGDSTGELETDDEAVPGLASDTQADAGSGADRRGRRRRRRRGGRRDEPGNGMSAEGGGDGDAALDGESGSEEDDREDAEGVPAEARESDAAAGTADGATDTEESERRRRGRRGGRRRRREPGEADASVAASEPATEQTVATPAASAYVGPTPANPFGGTSAFDIFDAIEQAEEQRALTPRAAAVATEAARAPAADPVPAMASELAASELAAPIKAAAEPEVEVPPGPELQSGPVIQPVLIGAASPTAEKKRGWWRR